MPEAEHLEQEQVKEAVRTRALLMASSPREPWKPLVGAERLWAPRRNWLEPSAWQKSRKKTPLAVLTIALFPFTNSSTVVAGTPALPTTVLIVTLTTLHTYPSGTFPPATVTTVASPL